MVTLLKIYIYKFNKIYNAYNNVFDAYIEPKCKKKLKKYLLAFGNFVKHIYEFNIVHTNVLIVCLFGW